MDAVWFVLRPLLAGGLGGFLAALVIHLLSGRKRRGKW